MALKKCTCLAIKVGLKLGQLHHYFMIGILYNVLNVHLANGLSGCVYVADLRYLHCCLDSTS
jgi:hypothetical protein